LCLSQFKFYKSKMIKTNNIKLIYLTKMRKIAAYKIYKPNILTLWVGIFIAPLNGKGDYG